MTQSGHLLSSLGRREIPSGSFKRVWTGLVNSLVVSLWQSGTAQRIDVSVEEFLRLVRVDVEGEIANAEIRRARNREIIP